MGKALRSGTIMTMLVGAILSCGCATATSSCPGTETCATSNGLCAGVAASVKVCYKGTIPQCTTRC